MNSADTSTHISCDNTIYCAGCNERFLEPPVPGMCPRCGTVVSMVCEQTLADTLLLRELPSAGDAPRERADAARNAAELVGRQIHVYEVESLLGCGAMGRVYCARHTDLHRRCALKLLSPRAIQHDVDYVTRFYHEGRAAAALVHPNIVTIHAIGFDQGHHFLEMEFIAGRSLQQLMYDEGRLTATRATALVAQIAEGLAAAHREGIVHRDLKPDNVLLTHHGTAKIADFGLAKRVFWKDGLPIGHLVGTPNFMAPELFQGAQASPSSDVYALGITYYLLLTGCFPFVWTTLPELMRSACTDLLPNVREEHPEIPLEMAECLSLLLAKSPASRPVDGIEAAQLLRAVLGQVRDLEALLQEAFGSEPGVRWMRSDNRYRLSISLPDGRQQTIFMEPSDHATQEQLLMIYSVCCPAQPDHYEYALRLNTQLSHGGVGIREVGGEPHFCMVDTYPRATVDAEEIRRSAMEIAVRADEVEKLLTGGDCH